MKKVYKINAIAATIENKFLFIDDQQLVSENLSQRKHRPQAATTGGHRKLSVHTNETDDEQSTLS